MKGGLQVIPSEKDLLGSYEKLLHSPEGISTKELISYVPWVRLDPRLGEILVSYFSTHWTTLNPMEILAHREEQPWAAVWGVLLEFVKTKLKRSGKDIALYRHWMEIIVCDLKPAQGELFFLGLNALGGQTMLEEAAFPLHAYEKWGYLSRENLIQKSPSPTLTKEVRHRILKDLLEKSPRIRTTDYWDAIGRSISRRQAERDLTDSSLLRRSGATKNRRFLRRG